MKQTVVITSGIPGSGKSTFARCHFPEARFWSADDFPGLYVDGELQRELIGPAHQWCLRGFTQSLLDGEPLIVVDNTNTSLGELAPYAALAQAHGAELDIITVECDAETAAARNTHGVPLEIVEAFVIQLAKRELPEWWPARTISQIQLDRIVEGTCR